MRFESGWGLPLVITAILACMRPTPMPSLLAAEPTADERAAVSPARSGLRGEADGGAVWIVSDGIGTDVEAAKLDAYRNAVRQAVGAYVDATTIVANDQLISDEIIALSGAFVSQVEVLPGSERKDGPFTRLRVKAQVETGKVLSALHKKNVPTKSEKIAIDADSILAELATKEDRLVNAEKLLAKLFEGYPQKCFRASIVGQPKPAKQEGENVQLLCRVRVEADGQAWKEFSEALQQILATIAIDQSVNIFESEKWSKIYGEEKGEEQFLHRGGWDRFALFDQKTSVVHQKLLGQEALLIGLTAIGKVAGSEQQMERGSLSHKGWRDWPKEHINVAVLDGQVTPGGRVTWREYSVPLQVAKKLPKRWVFSNRSQDEVAESVPPWESKGKFVGVDQISGMSRLHFCLVRDQDADRTVLQKVACRRVGCWFDGVPNRPFFLGPCVVCFDGSNTRCIGGVATGFECSLQFEVPRSGLKDLKIRCIAE